MKKILTEIQDGEFAREWMLENKANKPVFNALRRATAASDATACAANARRWRNAVRPPVDA